MKILVSANSSFNIVNFRAGLIKTLMADGHEVVTLVPADEYTEQIRKDLGCEIVELEMSRRGTSPVAEAMTLLRMYRSISHIKPDVIVSYTIKNNIYGGLIGRVLGIPILPNITGLGSLFSSQSLLARAARKLYSIAFRKAPIVFFQNDADANEFLSHKIVNEDRTQILPGSGVDLLKFAKSPLPNNPERPVFLLIGRMLWEKGVAEFVESAGQIKQEHDEAQFWIVGGLETPGDAAIPKEQMLAWERKGAISYLGNQANIKHVIDAATCVVLPTYYKEGTPRSLLESAASGRPLITTEMPGCRDTVIESETGYLVEPRSVASLTKAMRKIAESTPEELTKMGEAGRSHIAANFDEKIVINAYRNALANLSPSNEHNVTTGSGAAYAQTQNISKGEAT